MQTVTEAVQAVTTAFADQILNAAGAPPNEAVDGDAAARRQFLGLLPPEQQRRVFLAFAKKPAFWPRIRTLVGSPPFGFLRPEDEGAVRAGGVAKGRVRLTKETTSANSFVAQFVDEHERDYQALVARGNLGTLAFVALANGHETVVDVRIRKRTRTQREQMLREGEREKLTFPAVGSRLSLTPNALTRDSVGSADVVVKRLQPLDSSLMARLVVKSEEEG